MPRHEVREETVQLWHKKEPGTCGAKAENLSHSDEGQMSHTDKGQLYSGFLLCFHVLSNVYDAFCDSLKNSDKKNTFRCLYLQLEWK